MRRDVMRRDVMRRDMMRRDMVRRNVMGRHVMGRHVVGRHVVGGNMMRREMMRGAGRLSAGRRGPEWGLIVVDGIVRRDPIQRHAECLSPELRDRRTRLRERVGVATPAPHRMMQRGTGRRGVMHGRLCAP
jgi:hypothetical protein